MPEADPNGLWIRSWLPAAGHEMPRDLEDAGAQRGEFLEKGWRQV